MDGPLPKDLQEIITRLERLEGQLGEAGRAGEQAGRKIESGADDAAEALRRVAAAGEEATEDLFGVGRSAGSAARELRRLDDVTGKTAAEIEEMNRAAERSSREMREMTKAGAAAAGALETVEGGAEGAAEALDDTATQARQAARALDDAGDEAAQAGAKAAASSVGWNKLWAALDRNERVTSRWGRAQDAMRWDAWTARANRFKTAAMKVTDSAMWEKGAKGLDKFSKAMGGFKALLLVGKITAIVSAVLALLPLLNALGAGAIGAVGGLAKLAPALAAVLPLLVAGKLAMIAWKAASKLLEDQLKGIGDKWKAAIGTAVAETGGLSKALDYFDKNTTKLRENVASGFAIIGKAMSKSLRDITDYAGKYDFLRDLGKMWDGLGPIVERFGTIIANVLHGFINLVRMAIPAGKELTDDLEWMATGFRIWSDEMASNGKGAQIITKAYHGLKYVIGVVYDFMQGLGVIFRIGAEESSWMARSIHDAAQRFDEWAHSMGGQDAIRQWFKDMMPAFKETMLLIRDVVKGLFDLGNNQDIAPLINQIRTQLLPAVLALAEKFQGDLLPKLVELGTKIALFLSQMDFSALVLVVDLLIKLADACLWISQNVPGGNAALSFLFTTLLLAGPVSKVLGFLSGSIGKVVDGVKWLGLALKGGEGMSFMQKVVFKIGQGVMWLLRLLMGPLIRGIMLVGRVLAMAFLGSNPVGWIILAITALVAAFIWAYNNVDWFRNAVNAALEWLGNQVVWVYENFFHHPLDALGRLFTWLYENAVVPALNGIQWAWDALGRAFEWIRANLLQPVFDGISRGLGILAERFQWAVDGIRSIWNGLRNALAVPVNFLINTVWNGGLLKAWNWVADKLGLPKGDPIAPIPTYATGGAVRGPGTGTSDSILAAVSNNEHIWTEQETRRAGGHKRVEALRRFALRGGRRAVDAFLTYGGETLPRFASGGPVQAGQGWARGQVGKPYTWGSAGPNGYDCSGAMSALTNVVTNSLPWYRRLFSTGSFFPSRGAGGFVPGLGSAFAIGVSRNTGGGIGHMAGTLGGLNIESASGKGFVVGPAARGADNSMFPMKFSLPQVGGQFVSGGGGGFLASLWSIGKPILDAILNPLISMIPFKGPPAFMDVPKAMAVKAKDGFYRWAEEKLGAVGGGVTGGAGDPAVRAAVQAVAAGYGWGSGPEWAALSQLIQGESGWNMMARNPRTSAAGLFQKMQSLHGPVEGDAAGQAQWGLNYIRSAYGSPSAALAKWLSRSPHWYDDGGMLPPGLSMVANGTGKPEPVFTSAQWDMLDPSNLHATAPSLEARAASAREDELLSAIHSLSTVLAERPPALSVSGDDTRRAVLDALAQRDRERRVRERYRY